MSLTVKQIALASSAVCKTRRNVFNNKTPLFRQINVTGRRNMPKKQEKHGKSVTPSVDSTGPLIANANNTVTVKVIAKPGAKQNGITDIGDEDIGVQIAAPPVEGEANRELIRYLSKLLGLRKSDVTLERGSKSRTKTLLVTGMNKDSILEKLRSEVHRKRHVSTLPS